MTAGDRSAGIALVVPRAAPGAPMLIAAATATAVATVTGLVVALDRLAGPAGRHAAAGDMVRVALALAAAVVAARLVPGHGKLVGFAVMALTAVTYVAVLVVTREFGPEDRAKFARVFKR